MTKTILIYFYLSDNIEKNYSSVKNDLLQSGVATSVTKTSAPLTQSWSDGWGQEWEGKDPTIKQISEDTMKMAGLVKQQACNLLQGVILMCKNIQPIQQR